jgi:trk system potassium uptake protein TrkH
MNVTLLFRILASVWGILGVALCIPGIVALFIDPSSAFTFLFLGVVIALIAIVVLRATWNTSGDVHQRLALLVVVMSWLSACLIGALPYYILGVCDAPIDALFESSSGFTGTGASILIDIESVPPALLLWRSMTQWLAGMGIVLFFLAILPIVGVAGGGQLFRAEVTGPQKDKITPRVKETAQKLWRFYLLMTLLLVIILLSLGMGVFDAVNHAMTTLATGGFSTKNNGIAFFASPAIEWVITLFMLIASISFMVHFKLFLSRDRQALFNTELKGYLTIVGVITLIVTMRLWNADQNPLFFDALRVASFTVIDTVSTTGFTNYDYTDWSHFIQYLLILLMVMGGMSGSTSGGIKCIRLLAAFKQLTRELIKVVHPSAVVTVRINDNSINEGVANAIWGLIFLYFLVFSILTGVLTFSGLDMLSAGSTVISSLSNIGPAMGDFGPFSNFSNLNLSSKIAMIAGMIIGRLEFYTIVILFTPYFWRR